MSEAFKDMLYAADAYGDELMNEEEAADPVQMVRLSSEVCAMCSVCCVCSMYNVCSGCSMCSVSSVYALCSACSVSSVCSACSVSIVAEMVGFRWID